MEEQWMLNDIPQGELELNLSKLKNFFFGEMVGHTFTLTRLYWLNRWISGKDGEIPESFYQTELSPSEILKQQIEYKRIKFLTEIWNEKYFHPFFTVKESYYAVNNIISTSESEIAYCISLSSTNPGSIRLSYYSKPDNKIYHRRVDVNIDKSKDNEIVLNYNFPRIVEYIEDYVCKNNKTENKPIFVEYIREPSKIKKVYYQ
jgi:hypothetical protein